MCIAADALMQRGLQSVSRFRFTVLLKQALRDLSDNKLSEVILHHFKPLRPRASTSITCLKTVQKMNFCPHYKMDSKRFGTELFKSSLAGSKVPFSALIVHTQGKQSTMKLKRIELNLSPPCCHSLLRSLSSPCLIYVL